MLSENECIYSKLIIILKKQSAEGQFLQTDCWPHFHLPADRGKSSSGHFRDDVWKVCLPLFAFYNRISPTNQQLPKFLTMLNDMICPTEATCGQHENLPVMNSLFTRILAINVLIHKYCYTPIRKTFLQTAIEPAQHLKHYTTSNQIIN